MRRTRQLGVYHENIYCRDVRLSLNTLSLLSSVVFYKCLVTIYVNAIAKINQKWKQTRKAGLTKATLYK